MKTAPVIVEKIYAAREGKNQEYSTLQLRQEREKPKTSGNLRNLLLSGNPSKTAPVVAFETIHNDAITALNLVEGCDFGKVTGQDVTLKITEVTEKEYMALPAREKVGFQIKINNPDEGKQLVKDGGPVFRKVSLDIAEATDKIVAHDGMVEAGSFDIMDYREIADVAAPALEA